MYIWCSDTDTVYPAKDDNWYIGIDGENGILRINDNETDGMRTTTVGFIGPNSKENANRWAKFIGENDERQQNVNIKVELFIKECFELPG